jgi:hypothetical protein
MHFPKHTLMVPAVGMLIWKPSQDYILAGSPGEWVYQISCQNLYIQLVLCARLLGVQLLAVLALRGRVARLLPQPCLRACSCWHRKAIVPAGRSAKYL